MSKTIYKYPLDITITQVINLPSNAEILTIQMQRDTPCLWALVDISEPTKARTIRIFGTGHLFDLDRYKYIGMFQVLTGGGFVGHVFEELS